MTDRAIEQYLDIKVSISVSISIKIYLSNLNIQYLFRPYPDVAGGPATGCMAVSPLSGLLLISPLCTQDLS